MEQELRIKVKSNRTIKSWIEFINVFRVGINPKVRRVTFDFSEHYFMTTYHLVSMACLIEEYYKEGVEIVFEHPAENITVQYLNKLRFFEYWESGFDRTRYTLNASRKSLFLWKTDIEKLDPFASDVQSFYEDNFFSGNDCTNLNNAITETVNNIYDHSGCDGTSYAFAQYYPAKKYFKVSVCDFGVGIPFKVNEYLAKNGKEKVSNDLAMEKAFRFKFTTESTPRNRGFGLDNLKKCAQDGNGTLSYYSLNSAYYINEKGDAFSRLLENYFPGTLIDLKIDARDLPKKDFFGGDFNF